jgi:hypothetical protein
VGLISCPETSVKIITTSYVMSQKNADLIETERVYWAIRAESWHTNRVTVKFKTNKEASRKFNTSKPSGHYLYHQFNIQQFYVLPTQFIYLFCVDIETNSDYFPIQHSLVGFCDLDGECLLCSTNWILKYILLFSSES